MSSDVFVYIYTYNIYILYKIWVMNIDWYILATARLQWLASGTVDTCVLGCIVWRSKD